MKTLAGLANANYAYVEIFDRGRTEALLAIVTDTRSAFLILNKAQLHELMRQLATCHSEMVEL